MTNAYHTFSDKPNASSNEQVIGKSMCPSKVVLSCISAHPPIHFLVIYSSHGSSGNRETRAIHTSYYQEPRSYPELTSQMRDIIQQLFCVCISSISVMSEYKQKEAIQGLRLSSLIWRCELQPDCGEILFWLLVSTLESLQSWAQNFSST